MDANYNYKCNLAEDETREKKEPVIRVKIKSRSATTDFLFSENWKTKAKVIDVTKNNLFVEDTKVPLDLLESMIKVLEWFVQNQLVPNYHYFKNEVTFCQSSPLASSIFKGVITAAEALVILPVSVVALPVTIPFLIYIMVKDKEEDVIPILPSPPLPLPLPSSIQVTISSSEVEKVISEGPKEPIIEKLMFFPLAHIPHPLGFAPPQGKSRF